MDGAKAAWKERDGIARTVKYNIGSAYHQIVEAVGSRISKQEQKAHEQQAKFEKEESPFNDASQLTD